jgi:hypothetical protein
LIKGSRQSLHGLSWSQIVSIVVQFHKQKIASINFELVKTALCGPRQLGDAFIRHVRLNDIRRLRKEVVISAEFLILSHNGDCNRRMVKKRDVMKF